MIVRISSTAVLETSLNPHLEHVQRNDIPNYEAASGLVSVWLLERRFVAYVEVMTLSLWQSEGVLKELIQRRRPVDLAKDEYSGWRVYIPAKLA